MKKNSALIIVDMLNDFVLKDAPLKVPGALEIIKPINREISNARSKGHPIIYICDSHGEEDREFDIYPPHAITGSRGAKIVDPLKPGDGDIIVYKKTLSGFHKTGLMEILRENGIEEIFITGCVVNICVFLIAAEAVSRGFVVNVVRDAVAGFSKRDYDFSLEQLNKYFKVNLV
jgi:nicotinamidase-related amidase